MVGAAMKVNVREAARLLSVSESEVYRWVDDGEIPFLFVNHHPLFNREELLEWATARRMMLSPELFEDEGQHAQLAPALEQGGVHHDVGGTDIPSTLAAVVACLPIEDEEERDEILEIMAAREQEASTGIGGGIAIPHVRNPIVFAGRPPVIALCFLDHSVPFAAIDGKPVTTVFAMMTPTVRAHLQLLSHLSHALHDDAFVAALQRRANAATILAEARRVDAQLAHPPEPSPP
jgi:PTS system nitrogen regulatory IIA component